MNVPYIQGESNPFIGIPLQYELKIDRYHSVRWQAIYKNGQSLSEKDNEMMSRFNTNLIRLSFLNDAAGKEYIIKAWYKTNENSGEISAIIYVKPVFGTPALIVSSWQDWEGYNVSEFNLRNITLVIRTANIPEGGELKINLYDYEKVGANKKDDKDFKATVDKNGIAKLRITKNDWLAFRKRLFPKYNFGEDSKYQIYAIIKHTLKSKEMYAVQDNPSEITLESPVITMINNKTIRQIESELEQANKSALIDQGSICSLVEPKKKITLKIRAYFDGTGGNMENIQKMIDVIEKHCGSAPNADNYTPEVYEKEYKKYREKIEDNKEVIKKEVTIEEEKIRLGLLGLKIEKVMTEIDPTDNNSSYNQTPTNIPIMYNLDQDRQDDDNINGDTTKGIKQVVVYVSGVGTHTSSSDDTAIGMGMGADYLNSGIPSKVKEAMDRIKIELKDKFAKKEEVIEQIEVSAFGFSRGAATARNFVGERQLLIDALTEVLGVPISAVSIVYKMVGIFDTVCSVTPVLKLLERGAEFLAPIKPARPELENNEILELQAGNVKEFKLAMGTNVEQVIHLTAADEYRAFFPLTNIKSSIAAGKGFQLALPGSHCDIGGGDPPLVKEQITETGTSDFIDNFIHNGWYQPEDKKEETKSRIIIQGQYSRLHYYNQYTVSRTVYAEKGYNKIPLQIMLKFIKNILNVKYENDILLDECDVQNDLKELQATILNLAMNKYNNIEDSVSAVKLFNELRFYGLRRKYLHLSASPENGQTDMTAALKDMARRDEKGNPFRGQLNG